MLNYRGGLGLGSNGLRQASTGLITCTKQQLQVPEHLEDAATRPPQLRNLASEMEQWLPWIWNTLRKEFELPLPLPLHPPLRHVSFESSFPHLEYSPFHCVALWYFPHQLLFSVVMLMKLIMPIPMEADSFIKHTISLTRQGVKWWFRGLNSSCWSNYTR